ncbi:ribosome-binding factor A [Candidatus Babeliales bacterium]|nr:ribosome-binding factor A [Candidatus Babeliales bacterium]
MSIRRAQKESLFLRTISQLFLQAAQDNPELVDLYPNRVHFAANTSICTVFFITPHGKEYFEQKLPLLKLYKPSLRASISKEIKTRHTPDFIFRYDDQFAKQQEVESLLESLKKEGKL